VRIAQVPIRAGRQQPGEVIEGAHITGLELNRLIWVCTLLK
jgi:hypothetical protein